MNLARQGETKCGYTPLTKLLPSQLCQSREPCCTGFPVRPHPTAPFVPAERSGQPYCPWFGPKDDQLAFRGSLLFSGCLLQLAQQGVRGWLRGNMRLRCIPEYPEYLNEFVQVLISQLKPQDTTALGYRSWTSFVWVHCKPVGELHAVWVS